MTTSQDIRDMLEAYQRNDPASRGLHLRLMFAQIVIRRMDSEDVTPGALAAAAQTTAHEIEQIIHSDRDCTFDEAGRILFALGTTAAIVEVDDA